MEDTLDAEQIVVVLIKMLGSSKRTAPRDMSMAVWMLMTIGRGDDARLVFLADLLKPVLLRVLGECATMVGECEEQDISHAVVAKYTHCCLFTGPSPAFLVSAVLRGGKRQFAGKVAYSGAIRAQQALHCCHGALARNLAQSYTLDRMAFPSPADKERWRHTPLWMSGSDPSVSISYTQQADSTREFLAEAGVVCRKVTHLWRVFKARDLDEQGVADDVSKRQPSMQSTQ